MEDLGVFVNGFELGSRTFREGSQTEIDIACAQAEVIGGSFAAGFDEALAFASEVAARSAQALT